jgi:hypothetical protein
MSAEHHNSHEGHERHTGHHEASEAAKNLEAAGAQAIEHLKHSAEASAEHSAEHQSELAKEAREKIHGHEQAPEPAAHEEQEATPAPQHPVPAFLNRHLNYAQTLASVQRRLTPVSRGFSHVIHAPIVEKTSDALENTVARPSVTAGATWTALIVGAIFYFTARRYGYALSGSEIELSFIIGAVIGLIIEWFWRTFIHRPKH